MLPVFTGQCLDALTHPLLERVVPVYPDEGVAHQHGAPMNLFRGPLLLEPEATAVGAVDLVELAIPQVPVHDEGRSLVPVHVVRSEERRVGKESSARWTEK